MLLPLSILAKLERTPSSSSDITPVATFYGCRRIYGMGLSLEGCDKACDTLVTLPPFLPPITAIVNAAYSPLTDPPLMTVISVLDDEGCFANKTFLYLLISNK